ncbi:MAG: 2-amino-4-hydroxy-6-hydroxymethyldihydropteridine diphosphokinase [Bacteroidales bacterium]|jgi:2-amino-4-hydroxy-6-hydroxymethyldihydropteridine diphosphokinase
MSQAYLLLGSNQGDKVKILQMAIEKLRLLSKKQLVKSPLYESEPWGFEADEWFLNMAVKLETDINPRDLLKMLLEIERELGRVRGDNVRRTGDDKRSYSSRTIDIDILFFDNEVINEEDLIIPHPRMQHRKFVLLPLFEIAPKLIHPVLNKDIEKLLEECDDKSKVIIIPA